MEYIKVVFGSDRQEQTNLAYQVASRTKTAASAVKYIHNSQHGSPPVCGEKWRIMDGYDNKICTVKVTKVSVVFWKDINEQIAVDEGDGSLENWLKIHEPYYSRLLLQEGKALSPTTELYIFYFALIA